MLIYYFDQLYKNFFKLVIIVFKKDVDLERFLKYIVYAII